MTLYHNKLFSEALELIRDIDYQLELPKALKDRVTLFAAHIVDAAEKEKREQESQVTEAQDSALRAYLASDEFVNEIKTIVAKEVAKIDKKKVN